MLPAILLSLEDNCYYNFSNTLGEVRHDLNQSEQCETWWTDVFLGEEDAGANGFFLGVMPNLR